ncbi:MAG: peptidoglycan-binding protein [Proteobacteria bacterium]|nr:peptidoglycan-binding protein [Pseudomonadota bacterium]
MALTPFYARLALTTFLAIGGGIGFNLLANQHGDRQSALARARQKPTPGPLDTNELDRLAFEASTGAAASGKAWLPPEPAPRQISASKAPSAPVQRIGSFAPSSGSVSLTALPGANPAEARLANVRAVQQELQRRGYEPGPASGSPTLVTRAAVMAYEFDQGLPLTADPSPEVLAHLRHGTSAPGAAIGLDGDAPRPLGEAENVIRAVQQALGKLGYLTTPADGMNNDETVRAIREFEMDQGLIPTGRISGPLVAKVMKQQAQSKAEAQ